MQKLYNLGARSFWIHNTGPIGCLPYLLTVEPITEDQTDSVGCAIPYNELSQHFNVKLKEAVDQLREDLPLAAITYVDIYSVRYSLFTEAERYGMLKFIEVLHCQ